MKKGVYLLHIQLHDAMTIHFGTNHSYFFHAGSYFYIGSALNGLDARLHRHLSQQKKFHWHIDYLLKHGQIKQIFYKITSEKEECLIAKKIAEKLSSIPNFGSSDCRCSSHLFYTKDEDISAELDTLRLVRYIDSTKNKK